MKKFLILILLPGWGINLSAMQGNEAPPKRQRLIAPVLDEEENNFITVAPGVELDLDQKEPHDSRYRTFRQRLENFATRKQPYIALVGYDEKNLPTVYYAPSFFQHIGGHNTSLKSHASGKPMDRLELHAIEPDQFFVESVVQDESYKLNKDLQLDDLKSKLKTLNETVLFAKQKEKVQESLKKAKRRCFIEATGVLKNLLLVQRSVDKDNFPQTLYRWLNEPGTRYTTFLAHKGSTTEDKIEKAIEKLAEGPQPPTEGYTDFLNQLKSRLSNNTIDQGSKQEIELLYSALFSESLATLQAKDEAVKALILMRLASLLLNYKGPCSNKAKHIKNEYLHYASQLIPPGLRGNALREDLSTKESSLQAGLRRMSITGDPDAFFASWGAELEKYPFFQKALHAFSPLKAYRYSEACKRSNARASQSKAYQSSEAVWDLLTGPSQKNILDQRPKKRK